MGYYSTMHYCNFKSNFQLKELQEKLEAEEIGYYIQETGGIGFELVPEGEDYYGKHYEDETLAKYLSEVIAPGEYTRLEFDGEDGCWWGWVIFSNEVKPIQYVATVEGIFIDEYITRQKERKKNENTAKRG